jgi:hypothetical protein
VKPLTGWDTKAAQMAACAVCYRSKFFWRHVSWLQMTNYKDCRSLLPRAGLEKILERACQNSKKFFGVPMKISLPFYLFIFCFVLEQQPPPVGQSLLIHEVSRSHKSRPTMVGLLWTSDQPVAETSTWQVPTLTTHKHPCRPVGFKTAMPVGQRPQTYTLGYGYIEARTNTTQQSGQTPDTKV